MTEPSVAAINLSLRLAFLEDGRELPITNLFDALGDETADPGEAVSFVCGADRLWLSDRCDRFATATVH